MATIHEVGSPINDGERGVLATLRRELPDEWSVVANFEVLQGGRSFECDALAVSPNGWAYLIETKWWLGEIVGNDQQWELPSLMGADPRWVPNPVPLITKKAKVIASFLRENNPSTKALFIQPLVVIASADNRKLVGKCDQFTVGVDEMVGRVHTDPREEWMSRKEIPAELASLCIGVLTENARPIAPSNVLGPWSLVEKLQSTDRWDVWLGGHRRGGTDGPRLRIKTYRLDPYLVGQEAENQRLLLRQGLKVLERLDGANGAAPLVGGIEELEDVFAYATLWPDGESVGSLLQRDGLDENGLRSSFVAVLRAVESIHSRGIIHRNLSPDSCHILKTGRALLTDFDYASSESGAGVTALLEDESGFNPTRYLAPELVTDPGLASQASDVFSLGVLAQDLFGDSYDRAPSEWARSLERAVSVDAKERQPDAGVFLAEIENVKVECEPFEPNDLLQRRWIVRERAQPEGALSEVYHVYDSLVDADYAAKFTRPDYRDRINLVEEYEQLNQLERHHLVVFPEFPQQLDYIERNGVQLPCRTNFLLSPWIDGTALSDMIKQRLPLLRAVEIVAELADALGHLHGQRLIHRDVKPENVIVATEDGAPRLMDFNVSRLADAATETETGTPAYRPPDYSEGWDYSADTYAATVVLCELIASRRLGGRVGDWLDAGHDDLTPTLELALRKGVAESSSERFPNGQALAEALTEALTDLRQPKQLESEAPPPPEEGRANWNPYLPSLLRLFSQSSVSNAGTRGLDDFGRWFYVPTRIDKDLFGAVIDGSHRLILISGNAGDGKTAFLQKFEERCRDLGAQVEIRDRGNGSKIALGDRAFLTNWDGSQDEEGVSNDATLREFLAPFSGSTPKPDPMESRLLAINEGRLLDFLTANRDEFAWLDRRVDEISSGNEPQIKDPPTVMLVNLNHRALTLARAEEPSLVETVLSRISDERLWEACSGCDFVSRCYAYRNSAALRDPSIGPRIADRVRQTIDIVRLRRKLHVTMRDLISVLAYVAVGNRTCDEIGHLVDDGDVRSLLNGLTYNALFAASSADGAAQEEAQNDRLLRIVAEADVGKRANPAVDRRLWLLGAQAWEQSEAFDAGLLDDLRLRASGVTAESGSVQAARFVHSSIRRRHFLLREDPGWLDMYPYGHLRQYLEALEDPPGMLVAELAQAISRSGGLRSHHEDKVAVRLVESDEGMDRTFVTRPIADFRVEQVDTAPLAELVEHAPAILVMRHVEEEDLRLEIDLDLFDTLMRIRGGFTPSREEMRGAWLNLKTFKSQLANRPSRSLLLARSTGEEFAVERSDDGLTISLKALAP